MNFKKITNSDTNLDADLIIVGGGIVGATLACGLIELDLRVILIEAKPIATGLANRRAYALTLLTGEIFQSLGVWDWIAPRITAFQKIRLSDGDYPGVVFFRPEDLHRKVVGYVGEHYVLLQAIYDRLAQAQNTRLICPAEVLEVQYRLDRATVKIRRTDLGKASETDLENPSQAQIQQLRTALVVAADGSQSPLRQAAQISTHGWKYWQSCLGFTVRTEKSHENVAYERFWPTGPFAILPLPGNRCQVVWTAPHAEAQRLAALPEPEFLKVLYDRYGSQMGQIELETPPIVFPVQLMQSDRYVQPRLALIGDAAHCCHPVGGQGMNQGIRDAAVLIEVLQAAHDSHQDIGSLRVLKRYERWRKLENLTILGFTDFLNRLFSNQFLPFVFLRRFGLILLRQVYPLRLLALKLMTGQLGHQPRIAAHIVSQNLSHKNLSHHTES
jgi:2-octaprenyl-6-methoxyphenol hydroxylase